MKFSTIARRNVWCVFAHGLKNRQTHVAVPIRWVNRGWPGESSISAMMETVGRQWEVAGHCLVGSTLCYAFRRPPYPALTKESADPKPRKPRPRCTGRNTEARSTGTTNQGDAPAA